MAIFCVGNVARQIRRRISAGELWEVDECLRFRDRLQIGQCIFAWRLWGFSFVVELVVGYCDGLWGSWPHDDSLSTVGLGRSIPKMDFCSWNNSG